MLNKKLPIIILVGLILLAICPAASAQEKTGESQVQTRQTPQVMGEDDRLPFMREETGEQTGEPTSGGLLIKAFGAMLLIIGLLFFGAWGLKKLGYGTVKGNEQGGGPDFAIIKTAVVAGGQTLSLVRFGEKILLIGSTSNSFTLLSDQTQNDLPQKIEAPRSVSDLLAEEEGTSFNSELLRAENLLQLNAEKGGRVI
ncbi:MAG: flagellar biosynthetic protein FliO [Pyrinomonadaceae bacterium]